jgi:hypothetical protein
VARLAVCLTLFTVELSAAMLAGVIESEKRKKG